MRQMRKLLIAASVLTIVTALGWPATAGSKAPGGSLSIGSGARVSANPSLGDTVDLAAAYWDVRRQDTVRVQVLCLQGGGVVFGDNRVLSGSPSGASFTLGQPTNGTSVWSSGDASCRGDLYVVGAGNRVTQLASVSFQATG